MLIDSHCHLHDREFFTAAQATAMLERATQNDVKKIICIGTDVADSAAAAEFARQHEGVYYTFGIHPEMATSLPTVQKSADEAREKLKQLAKPVAIGEVGLDYHYPEFDRAAQIRLLEEMLQLAADYQLPLSFHVRQAFDDFLAVISNFPRLTGVVHSFSDNKKNLQRVLRETDFYVGVNGMATYSTLPTPPLERILLETDAPFLTPKPFRGIINEPGYVRQVAEWLAAKLGQDYQTVAEVTTKNAEQLFKL